MDVSWPGLSWRQPRSDRRGPFDTSVEAHKLRVVLDTQLERDHDGKLDYLRELLQLDQYEVFTQRRADEDADGFRFRIDLREPPDEKAGVTNDVAAVIIDRPDGSWSVSYIWAARNNMQAARNRAAPLGIDPEAAADAALLEGAASAIGADILITQREWLLTSRWTHGANPVSVGEALAVIGLHMRSTGRSTLRCLPSPRLRVGVDWTEFVQSWALLPAVLDVVSHAPSGAPWPQLLRETVYRLGKMLRARDQVLLAALTIDSDLHVDVASEVEALALSAMASFDIVARAANMAIPLGMDPRHCSLRSSSYLRELRKSSPPTGHVADDPKVSAIIGLVAGLRNTIHALPLRPVGYSEGAGRTEQRVLVSTDFANLVRDSAEVLDKADAWLKEAGPEELGLGGALVHAQPLANDLVMMVPTAVDALVASIPWPRDPVSPGWGQSYGDDDPMAPDNARRIQWLYGFC